MYPEANFLRSDPSDPSVSTRLGSNTRRPRHERTTALVHLNDRSLPVPGSASGRLVTFVRIEVCEGLRCTRRHPRCPTSPGELIGHVNRLQGILLFTYFRLEQGPISFIYHPSALRASRKQIDAFIAKRGLPIVLYRPWRHRRWDTECLIREFESRSSVVSSDHAVSVDDIL